MPNFAPRNADSESLPVGAMLIEAVRYAGRGARAFLALPGLWWLALLAAPLIMAWAGTQMPPPPEIRPGPGFGAAPEVGSSPTAPGAGGPGGVSGGGDSGGGPAGGAGGDEAQRPGPERIPPGLMAIQLVCAAAIWILVPAWQAGWLRHLVLGSWRGRLGMAVGQPAVRYLLASLTIGAMWAVALLAVMALIGAILPGMAAVRVTLQIVAGLALMPALARLMLWPVALALDRTELTLFRIWRGTAGNGWRLLVGPVLGMVAALLAVVLLSLLLSLLLPGLEGAAGQPGLSEPTPALLLVNGLGPLVVIGVYSLIALNYLGFASQFLFPAKDGPAGS